MTVLLAALLLAVDPATATPPVQPAPAAAPAPQKVKEKKICKSEVGDVGSRLSRRVCLSQREWDMQGNGVTLGSRSGSSTSQDH
jgi:hypothetical protein